MTLRATRSRPEDRARRLPWDEAMSDWPRLNVFVQLTLAENTKGGGLGTVCYIRTIFQYDAFDVRSMDLHVFPTNPVHYAEQANC